MTSSLLVVILGFALSAVGTGLVLYNTRFRLVDVPNQRSSHGTPTPRGGGIAIVGSVLVVTGYELRLSGRFLHPVLALVAMGLLALTLVGWIDDRRSMGVASRLLVHLACGATVATLVNIISPLSGAINVAWLLWWVVWSVASINIVNFMDGIDGMIASQGIVYGVFLFALLPMELFGSSFGLIIAAACSGFIIWNWDPAKIFMGDVGSGPLGLLFVIGGALALEGARAMVVFLPLFPLFLDALLTLVQRFQRGEKLTNAHRVHLYQRVVNSGVRHAVVSAAYALAAAVGALTAVAVNNSPPRRAAFAIITYLSAVAFTWKLVDGEWRVRNPHPNVEPGAPRAP